MKFREWMKIDEQQWISFKPMKINGVPADSIDFRVEDWHLGPKDGGLAVFPNGDKFKEGSFSVPLKDGTWLNVNKGQNSGGRASTEGGAARKLAVLSQDAWIGAEPSEQPMPPYWEKFAVFFYNNTISKPAEHVRPEQYEVELHQKYLQQHQAQNQIIVHPPLPEKQQDLRIVGEKPQVEPSNF